MKTELTEQIHELMEYGLRPVTMSDIRSLAPVTATGLPRPATRSQQLGDRWLRPRRAIVAAVAATTALASIAILFGVTYEGGASQPVIDKGAVQLLAKVANVAARQPAPRVRDGQYMYVETRAAVTARRPVPWTGTQAHPFPRHSHLKMITERIWVPVANSCGSAWTPVGEKCRRIGWLNDPTYRLLQTLPTNPHALLATIERVERGHGPSLAQEAFVTIGDLLRNTIAPPKVAAALYRAAALIPGITLVRHAKDAIGRSGIAVARLGPGADGGVREELIFSRSTLRLIGEGSVIARTGEVTGATAIIRRAFVDHRGQVPPAGQRSSA